MARIRAGVRRRAPALLSRIGPTKKGSGALAISSPFLSAVIQSGPQSAGAGFLVLLMEAAELLGHLVDGQAVGRGTRSADT